MEFKTFMAIYLSIIVAISAFAVFALPKLQPKNEPVLSNHFSVRWLGFVPDYKNTYPDYYICINDLKDSVLQMHIAMKLENWENSSYYFSVGPQGIPPLGWTLDVMYLGEILIDQTVNFIYSNISRLKPTSIPEGLLTESVELVVRAYRDSGYSDLYSEDSFNVTYHFIDKTSPGYFITNFNINSSYTEAYLVFPIYLNGANTLTGDIYLDGELCFRFDTEPQPMSTWMQCAIPLPVNKTTNVVIYSGHGWSCLDDAYVLAR